MTAEKDIPARETLLYVAYLDNDSRESLDLALELAVSHGACLEMIHVVDLDHARSGPDGQMGRWAFSFGLTRWPQACVISSITSRRFCCSAPRKKSSRDERTRSKPS